MTISDTSIRRLALRVRMMLHFCDFKTAEGMALGMVHLTSHSQQTGLCWASVPRDFIFLSFWHLVASSRIQWDAAGNRGADATHPLVGPCQPSPLPGTGCGCCPIKQARSCLDKLGSVFPVPGLFSQLLLPRSNCKPHQTGECVLV